MPIEPEQRFAFVVLLPRLDEAARLTRLLQERRSPSRDGDVQLVIPPVRGLGFFADEASQEALDQWWAATVAPTAFPIYLLNHEEGVSDWIGSLDGVFYVGVEGRSSGSRYQLLAQVRVVRGTRPQDLAAAVARDYGEEHSPGYGLFDPPVARRAALASAPTPEALEDAPYAVAAPPAHRSITPIASDRKYLVAHLPSPSGPELPAPSAPDLPGPSGPELPAPSGPELPPPPSTDVPSSPPDIPPSQPEPHRPVPPTPTPPSHPPLPPTEPDLPPEEPPPPEEPEPPEPQPPGPETPPGVEDLAPWGSGSMTSPPAPLRRTAADPSARLLPSTPHPFDLIAQSQPPPLDPATAAVPAEDRRDDDRREGAPKSRLQPRPLAGLRSRLASTSNHDGSSTRELASALAVRGTTLVVVGSRKGGVGKTSHAAGVAIVAGTVLDTIGHKAAIVDANVANPDAWGQLNLPARAATVRQVVAALAANAEPPTPVHAATPALACFPESREAGEYSRTEIGRLADYLRRRYTLIVVDMSNRLPDPLAGPEAAVAAFWLEHADVLVLPTTSSRQDFNGVLDYLDVSGLPPTVVAYIAPDSRRNRHHRVTRQYLEEISRRVHRVVEMPDEADKVRYAGMEGVPVEQVSARLRTAYRQLTHAIALVPSFARA